MPEDDILKVIQMDNSSWKLGLEHRTEYQSSSYGTVGR